MINEATRINNFTENTRPQFKPYPGYFKRHPPKQATPEPQTLEEATRHELTKGKTYEGWPCPHCSPRRFAYHTRESLRVWRALEKFQTANPEFRFLLDHTMRVGRFVYSMPYNVGSESLSLLTKLERVSGVAWEVKPHAPHNNAENIRFSLSDST